MSLDAHEVRAGSVEPEGESARTAVARYTHLSTGCGDPYGGRGEIPGASNARLRGASISLLLAMAQPASATWDQLLVRGTGNSASPTSRKSASDGTFYVTWQSQGSHELFSAKP